MELTAVLTHVSYSVSKRESESYAILVQSEYIMCRSCFYVGLCPFAYLRLFKDLEFKKNL